MMKDWERQVKNDGVEVKYEAVEKIEEVKSKETKFVIKTSGGEYECKAVIIAQGKTPRRLGAKGEKELTGKGVSYCVSCDGQMFRGKTVAVIGGGNSALEAALVMSQLGKKVYLLNNSESLTGFESMQKALKAASTVEVSHNADVKAFIGEGMLKSVEVLDRKSKKTRKIDVDAAFVEIGYIVDKTLIGGLLKLDESDHVVITSRCQTFYPGKTAKIRSGIFAAGDTTDTPFKQIVVAAGEGAKAALQAYNYIHGI